MKQQAQETNEEFLLDGTALIRYENPIDRRSRRFIKPSSMLLGQWENIITVEFQILVDPRFRMLPARAFTCSDCSTKFSLNKYFIDGDYIVKKITYWDRSIKRKPPLFVVVDPHSVCGQQTPVTLLEYLNIGECRPCHETMRETVRAALLKLDLRRAARKVDQLLSIE